MLSNSQRDSFIKPDQLCVGLFVHLDLNWTKHPFSFSSFKIERPDQIATIQGLGLQKIRYTPQKSDCVPPDEQLDGSRLATAKQQSATDTVAIKEDNPTLDEKMRLIDRMARQAEKIMECEREFLANLRALKLLWQNLFSNPLMVSEQASKMVNGMASSAMMDSEIAIHLVIEHKNGSDIYTHAMNVAVLSMILAKDMGYSVEDMKLVGLGALFHDVGCSDLPRRITEKTEPLTAMEAEIMHQHCKKGIDICNKLQLPYEAMLIVWQHHERIDGTGYPERLKGEQISPLASIVGVADAFDELCNSQNPAQSHTPHESLSIIYAQQRSKFDGKSLTALVHCLGVYPPGTIVLLSNGFVGMVVAVNTKRPLKPTVLVYDAANLKNEVIVIDIEQEPGLSVTKTISPNQLSPEIFDYFAPGKRTSYYFKTP
ncbi:putative nucleotidyltransferase with HDIG domain [Oxalobacteraceae bacterium GrIS 1.18]